MCSVHEESVCPFSTIYKTLYDSINYDIFGPLKR